MVAAGIGQSHRRRDGCRNRKAAQKERCPIALRWHIRRRGGVITAPRSDNPDYIKEYIDIFDFTLFPAEMEVISGLNKNKQTNPTNAPDNFPW